MSSFFFLSLRNTVLFPILTDWISIVDLVVLDSALCSKGFRCGFLSAISSDAFTHMGHMQVKSPNYYKWLMEKGIRVKNLNLTYFVTNKLDPAILKYISNLRTINILMYYCINLVKLLKFYEGVVSELDFNNCVDLNDEKILTVLPYMKNLTKVCLIETKCTDETIQGLIETCSNLSNIEIYYCDFMRSTYVRNLADTFGKQLKHFVPNEHLPSCDVAYALDKCPNLTSIGLSCMNLDLSCAVALAKCVNLNNLRAEDCHLTDDFICTAVINLALLQYLFIDANPALTDASLRKVAQSCPAFRQLSVEGCSEITDGGVEAIVRQCKRLERMNLSFCPKVTEKSLNLLYKECRSLQAVLFENETKGLGSIKSLILHRDVTIEGLELYGDGVRVKDDDERVDYTVLLLPANRGRMNSLVLQWNRGAMLTNSMLTQVFGALPRLRKLFISQQSFNDKHIDHLIKRCPLLESLGILNCMDVTEAGLLKAVLSFGKQLKEFAFLDARLVLSDDVLVQLTSHLPSVEVLTVIGRYPGVTDEGVLKMVDQCTQLRKLKVSFPSVTNKPFIHAMSVYGHQLTSLSVEGCPLITKHLLREIPSLCPVLRYLNIAKCVGIKNQPDCVMRLVQACDQLETVLYGADCDVLYTKCL